MIRVPDTGKTNQKTTLFFQTIIVRTIGKIEWITYIFSLIVLFIVFLLIVIVVTIVEIILGFIRILGWIIGWLISLSCHHTFPSREADFIHF